jgi:hypothetical protein
VIRGRKILMATLFRAYRSESAARRAVEGLRASDVPGRYIRLVTSRRLRDLRFEPVGGFAGPIGPTAPVGTYAGTVLLRRQIAGSFAPHPDNRRLGSFADTDRVVIVSWDENKEHPRVTGRLGLRRLLGAAALEANAVESMLDQLEAGSAVVLVEVSEIAPQEAQALLDDVAEAA